MNTPATYTKSGIKATTAAKLDTSVFDVSVESHELLKQAYTTYLANGRENLAKTLKRGEVRGGGKKPWKQKGTGRARFGSTRNPIWRGGGVVFGPSGNENYSRKLNIKSKRRAIRQALSLKHAAGNVIVLESFENKDGKVAQTVALMNKIGATGNILLVVSDKDQLVMRATQNIPNLHVVHASYVNVYDVMNADTMVITEKSLEIIHDWLKEGEK
jgi:large subunit ribosomal protein L4